MLGGHNRGKKKWTDGTFRPGKLKTRLRAGCLDTDRCDRCDECLGFVVWVWEHGDVWCTKCARIKSVKREKRP